LTGGTLADVINGSLRDIAGISNASGNVVGLMPHPEHAVEPGALGERMPAAVRARFRACSWRHDGRRIASRARLASTAGTGPAP
jgi:phosphoribosylformylglycinamidine (FGAM) synthase-like amidotransferase family enzyme